MKVKLGDVIQLNPSEKLPKGERARKIAMDNLDTYAREISGFDFDEYKGGTKFRNEDTLLARITPCLENGKTAYVNILEKDEVAFGSTEYFVLRANKELINPLYLYYLSVSSDFRTVAIKSMTGTSGRQRVQKEAILNYEFDLPSLKEQERIVSRIECLDDKKALNDRINDNLLELSQAIFKNKFPNVNDGSEKVGMYITNYDKNRKPLSKKQRSQIPGKYRYIGATSVNDYISKYNFDGIYLLLGEDGTVQDDNGYPILQYIHGKFWPNNHAHVLQGNKVSTEWLYLFFLQRNIDGIVTGAVQKKISQKNLNSLSIAVPDSGELAKFDNLIQPIFKQIRTLDRENGRLSKIKQELLKKFFSR
ncbi:restriction endonuclease subunit S [Ligilactobacillus ruminis]|uniref:restriction endonuclease subunit S n=1 Tax=Ligilactobacillus ruminis TaxID=1623 RepID=UPI001A2AE00A|nr:restriction endonuclease subunit S [Ligilactobacillus ruminis]MBD9000475.1 restriction endonuclease subunit S [Ligilactobacillus ruminis]MDB7642237.1 restriction endonuclease subunit S [Ligilactobacillus ruminis]MDB7646792.1 restriction endonuclease subunit S [Ligilactobacillus ruminis]